MSGGFDFSPLLPYKPVSIFIRHAERFSIRSVKSPDEALLTEKGKQDAFFYGRRAVFLAPVVLHHSPVERCRQTARAIAEGIADAGGEAAVDGPMPEIGGPYILGKIEELPSIVGRFGFERFLRKWFDGDLPDGLMLDLKKAAELQLKAFRASLDGEKSSHILVSHDWNIMLLREYFFRLKHEDIGTPGFLDGLGLYRRDGTEHLSAGNGREDLVL
jgi:hypothetical protein